MPPENSPSVGATWLLFAALTFVCWGLYGPLLHAGASQMGTKDGDNARFKAFLFVGVAYFLVAILAPAALLLARGATWEFPSAGWKGSLLAGALGAAGAFTLLLALGAGQPPNVVMCVVFGGAPIVASIYVIVKQGSLSEVKWPFVLGVAMVAVGGSLVALYRPDPPRPNVPAASAAPAEPAASSPRTP